MSEDWPSGDPFADPDDPAAQERAERRREREEKRRQRAAKDAEKEAAAAPPPPPPAEPEAPPRTPEEEFWDEDPAAADPAPAEAPTPPESAASEPAAAEPAAAQARSHEQRPATEEHPAEELPTEGAVGAAGLAAEESVAVEDPAPAVPTRQAWEFDDEGDPTKASGGHRGGRRGGGGILGGIRRHPIAIVALIVLLLVLWFVFALFQPFKGEGSGKVAVTIPKGASVSEVGEMLERKGVIEGSTLFGIVDSSTLFQIRVTLEGKRSDLYAGHFTMAKGMSYGAAIDALSTQPGSPKVTEVTIPPGESRSQAAKLVREDGIPGKYMKATIKSKYLDPADYGGKGAKNLEGFLFPDSWTLKPTSPVGDLVQLQLKAFKQNIKHVNMKYAKSKNLTIYDVLTIASMLEDEAPPKQQKQVASVIYNRLHEGMPLGIDATIRFATGNYTKPLTQSETEVDSPYNSRTHTGLPPGPINSPGLEAIQAAAHPAKTKYIFYVSDPNGCNELVFAKTEAEWLKDVERYEKARDANGGNQPNNCGE